MRMHGNRRYVKLASIGALAGLVLASPARAERVTSQADHGVLGVARDGTPYAAWTVGRDLQISLRGRQGRWRAFRAGRLPAANATLAGIRVSERPHRFVSVLTEDQEGRWISLARGSRITTIARAAPGSSFGPAGLTLDARQQPAIAYAVQRPSGKTYLRLVTFNRAGRPQTRAVTQKGFPSSLLPPGAAPVLVGRQLHVLETYTSAAIDWQPKRGGGWEGQYLFASVAGSPQGLIGGEFLSPTLWSAWTQVSADEIAVLLTSSAKTQETSSLTHGIFVSIAHQPGMTEPEVGAYDWVALGESWFVYAGLVIRGRGTEAWQLDGRLEALTIGRSGSHQLLLSREGRLEWFRSPGPALPGIEIRAGAVDVSGTLSGTVVGATTGTVEIYHERANTPRELVATSPVAADGSFSAPGLSTDPANLYRVVYAEPRTGIPFGFLPGVPTGVSD